EARQNVARLAHHASLALLTGNNENLWGYEDWGWKERLDGRTWGAHYYDELLPAVVAEVAPHVPYAPGSPFSPGGQHPNDPSHGTTHLWEQWNSLDWATYRDIAPRFVAEFGWQGPPTWSTLTTAISDDPLTPESPGMLAHQKAVDGNAKLVGGLVRHHRVPDDMATWHWAMQLNQANAITCALDWFRSLAPSCSGAVVWQLNDCWPVTSWAAIDGSGREKPLYFALQNAFAPRVVSVQPRGGRLVASLGNDTDVPWEGSLTCRRLRFDGTVCGSKDVAVSVPARGSVTIDLPAVVADADDPASEVVVVEALGTRGSWFFCEPRDSALPPAALEVSVAATDAGFDVSVTARTLVRDLTLLIDKVDPAARVDRGLVTLLPGESATFRVTGVGSLDVGAVCAPGILRCGNELMNPT
ncbi:MAG: glycoside hydrolase family 2 protein, partial [Dermatophilaceae bacterium]|nr:glycoside hydrolase family 2 protein [Dermatophilaceae bacterium]